MKVKVRSVGSVAWVEIVCLSFYLRYHMKSFLGYHIKFFKRFDFIINLLHAAY
jgi:hypothetical protein